MPIPKEVKQKSETTTQNIITKPISKTINNKKISSKTVVASPVTPKPVIPKTVIPKVVTPKKVSPESTIKKSSRSNLPIQNTSKKISQDLKPKPQPQNLSEKPQPTMPKQNSTYKKPKYKYAGKETISQILAKSIPKQFIPTNRMATILGFIFLATIVLALIQFPYGKLMSGDPNVIIGIGYPWSFLELGIKETESPLQAKGLFLDLIIYIILAYAIDVIISFTLNIKLLKSKEDLKKRPILFKNPKPTIADRITKKVFEK